MALSSKLYVPNNVVHKKRVAWILCFKIRPSQEILKVRDGTPLEAEEILTHKKSSRNGSVWHFFNKLDDPSNIVQKERVARILFFKIRSFQEILKIHDGTPLEAEEILTHKKSSRNGSVWHFFNKLDDPSNIVQKERVARILFFKIRSFQEILKIHDGTPLESEEILTYIKKPPKQIGGRNFDIHKKSSRNGSVWHLSSKFDVPNNVVHKKRVAWILLFKIRPSQEILKIRDGTPLESKRVAWILFFKISSFQEILKIHDGTPLESEEILTYIQKPPKQIGMALSSKLYVPNNVVHKKRVAWILCFKIRPSQEILKIRDGTPLEAEEILTHKRSSRNGSVWHFFNKLDDPSNIVQKERVARILFFKIRSFQEILKIHDGTPLEAEEILTHKKSSRNGSVWHFFNKLDDPSNIVQKERVARILFFKIISFQEILKIHDGTPLESEEILTYIKKPPKQIVWHFSSKFDVPNNVVHKKRVAWILLFKIRPSQEILKIRDGTPLESSQEIQKNHDVHMKRVAWILFFKISSFQEILKIHDGTPLESEEILTYIQKPQNRSKRVAWILCFKIRPSQEILKIRDGTPLEAEEILTHKKSSRNGSVWHFFNKLDDPSNIVQKERVARILFFKIRSFQEILKIHDGTPLEAEEILTHKKVLETDRSFQEILKIHDGTHFESEEILTYIKKPPKQIGMALSSKLYVPNNVVHKKRVAWILFFKIRPSQEILKIRDGTHLEGEEILTYIKKIALETDGPSQEILKIRDGTPLEAEEILTHKKVLETDRYEILKIHDGTPLESEEILTYIKKPPKQIGMALSSKLYVPNNVVQNKRVAWILCFKIRPSQEILKIRDGTPLESEEILTYIKKPPKRNDRSFQEILNIHDGTHFESEEILTYIKKPPKQIGMALSSKLYVPNNVVHKKRVAWILFFKIRPSQEILKIHDDTPLESEEILTYIKKKALETDGSSQEIQKNHDGTPLESEEILTYKKPPKQIEILKIHDGTHFESEEILTYIKKPPKQIGMALSSKLYVPNNVVHKKRVAWILFFKIRPSQEILKIRDGTHLEGEEILTYIKKKLSKRMESSQEIQKNHDDRVAWIMFFKISSFQEILKIHDGTPLESEEILTYIKKPPKQIGMALSSKLYVPNNVVHKKRVAWILFFKIRPSQEILKIRDGTHLEGEEILTYIKKLSKRMEILKIHDGTPLESEEILTYIKKPPKQIGMALSSKLYVPNNLVHKKRVAWILFFKIWPSQEILKIRDGTHSEAEEILTYIKKALETDGSFQEILKIHDE
ncbi:hypothetical protein OROMI_005120 [Orobanche minor]